MNWRHVYFDLRHKGLSHHDLDYVVVTVAAVDVLHSGDGPLFF